MVAIDTTSTLESFRRFLIYSTCRSFIPESYLRDPEIFPEKEGNGSIYVEAVDKVTLKKIRDITFVNARDVLGTIYVSKSGNSRLRWRQVRGKIGRVTGEASPNSIVNLLLARVLTKEFGERLLREAGVFKRGEAAGHAPGEASEATSETPPREGSRSTASASETPGA
jgi:hypothetical protein